MSAIETYFFPNQYHYDEGLGVRTSEDLHLIQQSVVVTPAPPKLDLIDLPGGDGSIDRTEALGGVRYGDRTITWTFALYPGDDWYAKQSEVSAALSGRRWYIELSEDEGRWYRGRISVSAYNRDRALRQITVTAQCEPWIYAAELTTVTASLYSVSSGEWTTVAIEGSGRVVPEVWLDQDAEVTYHDAYGGGQKTITLEAPTPGTLAKLDDEDVIKSGLEIAGEEAERFVYMNTVSASSGNVKLVYRRAEL